MGEISLNDFLEVLKEFIKLNRKNYKDCEVKKLYEKSDQENTLAFKVKKNGNGIVTEDVYALAVKEIVSSYTRNKDSLITMFKDLTQFLNRKKGLNYTVNFPPVPVSDSLKRQMFIVKYIQDKDHKISLLEDILWVSDRTINEDFNVIRGWSDNPITICGRPFSIEDIKRLDDRVLSESTVHPLMLTANLTEVIALLKGLKQMAEDPFMKGYAEKTAIEIWRQLTDYARKQIHFINKELMIEDDKEWFLKLEGSYSEEDIENTFHTEATCSRVSGDYLIKALKNGEACFIKYQGDSGTEIICAERIKKIYKGDKIKLTVEGEERIINKNNILQCTQILEEIQ